MFFLSALGEEVGDDSQQNCSNAGLFVGWVAAVWFRTYARTKKVKGIYSVRCEAVHLSCELSQRNHEGRPLVHCRTSMAVHAVDSGSFGVTVLQWSSGIDEIGQSSGISSRGAGGESGERIYEYSVRKATGRRTSFQETRTSGTMDGRPECDDTTCRLHAS